MKLWRFQRDYRLMRFYDEARSRGEKHSVAIEEAVQEYRESVPGARVSNTTVRRALAKHRPKGARTILIGVPADPSEQFQGRFRIVWKDFTIMRHRFLGFLMPAPDGPGPQITKVFDLCAGTRPIYPRHNKRTPKVKRPH